MTSLLSAQSSPSLPSSNLETTLDHAEEHTTYGDEDGEEFRNEKIFDFELLDDDEEYEGGDEEADEVTKQTEVDVEVDEEMDDEDDDYDDLDDKESSENGVDLDLEVIRDPFFQPIFTSTYPIDVSSCCAQVL